MKRFGRYSGLVNILAVIIVSIVAWSLRAQAANTLPIDYDEDDYLRAAQEFSHLIKTSNWRGFQETNYRPEHPQLSKIMFGIGILGLPEEPFVVDVAITTPPADTLPPALLQAARKMSVIWGTLTVALTAVINPMGGLFLAVHTFSIKYTSEIMLDAFAALMSTGTALAYYFSKRKTGKGKTSLLALSAILLGVSVSGKYMHVAVGIAILIDWFLTNKEQGSKGQYLRNVFAWGALAIATFILLNPFFWPDPLQRFRLTLGAVAGTTTNPNVQLANYPLWQPLQFLLSSVPSGINADGFLIRLDWAILILTFLGFSRAWNKESFIAIWLLVGSVMLFLWPTKWPQYLIVLTAPMCLIAAEGFRLVWDGFRSYLISFRRKREAPHFNRREMLQSIPWLVPGVIIFLGFTIFPIVFQVAISFTDFNSISIRDGLTGGVWREVWQGITGQVEPVITEFPYRSTEVQFTGPSSYQPVFDFISSSGILVFNILWTVLSVGLQAALGVGAALLLWNKRIRFRRAWQTLFILPWAIPEMIGALMWLTIFASPFGWLALAIQDLGKDIPFAFFNGWERNPNLTMLVLLIAGLWYGFPFMMLAATAGLKQVPTEVFDAAAIDGADGWQTLRHVTLPLLAPLIIPAIIIRGIFAFNQFYLIQLFGFFHGNFSMTTIATLSYNFFNPSGFFGANGQFAVSAVMNILTLLILVGFVAMFNRLSKAGEGVTYA